MNERAFYWVCSSIQLIQFQVIFHCVCVWVSKSVIFSVRYVFNKAYERFRVFLLSLLFFYMCNVFK